MNMTVWLDAILQGILLGGLYGLFAAGLSLMFGVMRLVNVAHGDFIVLAAFLALGLQALTGIESPFVVLLLLCPLLFAFGYALQRLLLNRVVGDDILRPVLVTFGLSVIVQNLLLELASADARRLQGGGIEAASLPLAGGLVIGAFPLLVFAVCVTVILLLQWLLFRTRLGRCFRAVSDDGETAALMGVRRDHLFALATAIAMGVLALAGTLMGIRSSFDPSAGPEQLIFAFQAVIVGGLGSMWGTLAGGVILGVAQSLGARIAPDFQVLAGHLVFLLVLMLRPRGLFPRRAD